MLKVLRDPKISIAIAVIATVVIIYQGFQVYQWWTVEALLDQAQQQIKQAQYLKATSTLAQAARIDQDNKEVHYLLAVANRRAGKTSAFQTHLEKAKTLGFDIEKIRRQEMLAVTQSGRLKQTEAAMKSLFEGSTPIPDDEAEEIYDALVKGYMASYRIQDAWKMIEGWLTWMPDSVEARMWRGDINQRMGNLMPAIQEYTEVLKIVPDQYEAAMRVGALLMDTNAPDKAREFFERGIKLRPNDPDAPLALANCELRLGEYKKAVEAANQVLAMPQCSKYQKASALNVLGRNAIQEGKYEDAMKHLKQALELAPENHEICYSYGQTLSFLDQRELSELYIKKSTEIKDRDAKLTDLTRQLVDEPKNLDKRFQVATIYWQQGLREEAIEWAKTCLEFDEKYIPALDMMRQYYASSTANLSLNDLSGGTVKSSDTESAGPKE